jgi:hypothetical protein
MGNEGAHRTPILLPFGNRNTHQACRIVRCLAPLSQACCAWPRLTNRASLAMPAVPFLAYHTSRACDDVHRQTLPTRPARPYPARPCHARRSLPPSPGHVHARTRLASHALLAVPARIAPGLPCQPRLSGHAFPCLPIPAFLTMPAKPCGSSIAPGLVTPCLPTPPFNATRSTPAVPRQPTEPVLQHLAMPAAPSTPDPAIPSLPLLPCRARTCPRGLACRALP